MDSLTQIVLGASMGEVVLGKKLGNRALLWGAIAGTIPDLDVIPGAFMGTEANLIFHRGPTHSIVFCVLAPLLFAGLAKWFYKSTLYQKQSYKWVQTFLALLVPILPAILLLYGLSSGALSMPLLVPVVVLLILAYIMWRYLYDNYLSARVYVEEVDYWQWYLMFFLGFITHVILDAFTTYGTQLYLPFSDYRVSWDVINVVDPLYTVPFMLCLFVVTNFKRSDRRRAVWNYAGILISSGYIALCAYHKDITNKKFERLLSEQEIKSERFMCTPTPFNNILWYCLCETSTTFETAHFSLLDAQDRQICLQTYEKSTENPPEVSPVRTLQWFSNDYLFMKSINEAEWQLADLRFGHFDFDCKGDMVPPAFSFRLRESSDDGWHLEQDDFEVDDFSEAWQSFVARIKGN